MNIDWGMFKCATYRRVGWFRVLGIGVAWKDLRQSPLMFSERNGYVRHFEFGFWSFKFLGKFEYWLWWVMFLIAVVLYYSTT